MSGVTKKFEEACHELRAGRIDFARFQMTTQKNWDSLARYILRRWNCPPSVSEEDVAQELLLAAWKLVSVWDPERPNAWPLGRFIVWRACNIAKAWVHHQRGALHTNVDRQPGRFAISFSQVFGRDEGEKTREEALGAQPARQEEHADHRAEHRRFCDALSREEAVAVAALIAADGDRTRAAQTLYEHPAARRIARLGNEKQAERKIAKAYQLLVAAAS